MASKMQFGIKVLTTALLWISCVSSQSCGIGCKECDPDRHCRTCRDGYYLNLNNNKCYKCFEGCSKCVNDLYDCNHQCQSGRWGVSCQYSCTSCSECVYEQCTKNCIDYKQSSLNYKGNIVCPDNKCSFRFLGPRKSDTAFSSIKRNVPIRSTQSTARQTTTPSTTNTSTLGIQKQITTQQKWTQSKQQNTATTMKRTPKSHLTTQGKTTSFMTHGTTTKQSDDTVYSEQLGEEARANQDGTTEQTKSQTNGLDPTVVYIVIAVVGVLVLTVADIIVVVVCIKRRKSRHDQVQYPQDANNKAESHQLADNAGIYSYASSYGNVVGNLATNVAESNTGHDGINARMYENVDDKTDMNASATANVFEAYNQYTNVREAENKYTSLSVNENVYFNVLD